VGGTYGQEDKIVAVAVYVSTEKKKKGGRDRKDNNDYDYHCQ
jgi:hypothetical protein